MSLSAAPTCRSSAFYAANIRAFLAATSAEVLGHLAAAINQALDPEQKRAWESEIQPLRAFLAEVAGWICLEFDVPRLGCRIDEVVVSGSAIFPLEFKCAERGVNEDWVYRRIEEKAFAAHLVGRHIASGSPTWTPGS